MFVLREAFETALGIWSIPLLMGIVLVAAAASRKDKSLERPVIFLAVSLPVWIALFAIAGTVFASSQATVDPVSNPRGQTTLAVMGLALLVEALVGIALAKTQRLLAISIVAFFGWFAAWTYFVAAMSVAGQWL